MKDLFHKYTCEKHGISGAVSGKVDPYLPLCPECRRHAIEMDSMGGMAKAFFEGMTMERKS